MKKLMISLGLILGFTVAIFAATFNIEVKGNVYAKTEDGEVYELDKECSVSDTDTIIVGEKSSVIFYVDGTKIIIRSAGVYKVKDIVK